MACCFRDRPAYRDRVSSTLDQMADEQFVSLSTFRRSGAPVPTVVWIAPEGDALVVTTTADSGKVKRLRRDPRVELRPSNRRGHVADDAPVTTGVAAVVPPDERATAALRRKYGLQYRLITGFERLFARGRRERVILRITAT
jgi:PPOX class probable F420-dependent enzyme